MTSAVTAIVVICFMVDSDRVQTFNQYFTRFVGIQNEVVLYYPVYCDDCAYNLGASL